MCLKSLFSEAIDADKCEHNPVKGVKLLDPNNVRDRLLSEAEVQRLFGAADRFDDYVKPVFYLLYFTGARLNEALVLQWADIEFDHGRIMVRDSKSGKARTIPIKPELKTELTRWRRFTGRSRWVLPNPTDTSQRIKNVRKGWLRLCSQALAWIPT